MTFSLERFTLTNSSVGVHVSKFFLPPANEVWGKVIFSQASVILFMGRGHARPGGMPGGWAQGGTYGRGCAWPGVGVCAWQGGIHSQGQECVCGGVAGGRTWLEGACMGETATAEGGTHPTGMHSCKTIFSVFAQPYWSILRKSLIIFSHFISQSGRCSWKLHGIELKLSLFYCNIAHTLFFLDADNSNNNGHAPLRLSGLNNYQSHYVHGSFFFFIENFINTAFSLFWVVVTHAMYSMAK